MENRVPKHETPYMLRKRGLDALCKELGPVGMAKFISQYEHGEGDYTAEKDKILKGVTLEEILAEIEESEDITSK